MSEHESKFNLGDNSDEGYTRSVNPDGPNYSFDAMTQRSAPTKPRNTAAPTDRPRAPQGARRPQKKAPQKTSLLRKGRRTPPQPPSVRQKELNQRYSPQQPPQRKPRPTGQQPQQRRPMTKSEQNRSHSMQRYRETQIKRLISYAVIALVVVGVLIALSLTVLFPINQIVVVGSGYYPNEQVVSASGLELGENIIRCKADQVSDTLLKSLPYIDHAEVKRSISGKVTITVTETTGKYAVLHGEQCVILNEEGKVLEIASAEKAVNYAVVMQASVDNPVPGTKAVFSGDVSLEKLLMLGNSLAAASIDKITAIDLTNMSDVIVTYDARLKLQLGTLSGLERKLALAQRVITRENELNPTQYGNINLTVEGKAYFSETKPEEDLNENVDESVTEPGDENLIG